MKKNITAILMASVLAVTSVQGVFAQEKENQTEVKESVEIIKERFERFESEKAYNVFDNDAFKLASVLNNAVAKEIEDSEVDLTQEYKTNMQNIPFYYSTYQNVYNTGNIISVVMNSGSYTGGAHGANYLTSYVGLKDSDKLFKFEDLFIDSKKYLGQMKKLVKEKIAKDPQGYYGYYENCVDKLGFEDRFFFDENGNLVIFYNPYEVAPYASGIKAIEFSYKELNGIIKPEIRDNMKMAASKTENQKEVAVKNVVLNGNIVEKQKKIISLEEEGKGEEIYIPVREIFELLGVEVAWSNEDGVILNNFKVSTLDRSTDPPKFVYDKNDKNIFDSFEVIGTKEVDGYKLSKKVELKNIGGISYISFLDFKKVLDGGIVNIDHNDMVNIYY